MPKSTDTITLSAKVAALAIAAYNSPSGFGSDIDDNEAIKQSDGSVRLALKQSPKGAHKMVYVVIPEKITLQLRPALAAETPETAE